MWKVVNCKGENVDLLGKDYQCEYPGCKQLLSSMEHLHRHIKAVHLKIKNIKCKWLGCPAMFSRKDNMYQHFRTHLKKKRK